jgi:hypothetical protein
MYEHVKRVEASKGDQEDCDEESRQLGIYFGTTRILRRSPRPVRSNS